MEKLSINIENEAQLRRFIGFLEEEVKDIQAQIAELKSKLPKEKKEASEAMRRTKFPQKKKKRYTYEKIIDVLKDEGKCLTTIDIVKKLYPGQEKKYYNTISSVISLRIKDDEYFRKYIPPQGTESYIGLKEWWDKDWNLKDGFEPKKTPAQTGV